MVTDRKLRSTSYGPEGLQTGAEVSVSDRKTEKSMDGTTVWTLQRIRLLSKRLSGIYGNPRHHNKDDPIDELVFIVLSNKTSEKSYLGTYNSLKKSFPDWKDLLKAPSPEVMRVLRSGGLSKKKEKWIRQILDRAYEDKINRGTDSLAGMNTIDAEAYLTSLPGIGLKSARCVLMYSLGRQVFPVDSHCSRILSRLGIIEHRRLTDRVQNEVQIEIPPDVRYALHVNLVAHGRSVCKARDPKCESCGVRRMCRIGIKNIQER